MINNREFKRLLAMGCIAELSVVHSINEIEFDMKDVGVYADLISATDDVPLDYHSDLVLEASDLSDGFSPTTNEAWYAIEVKSAKNGGRYIDHPTGEVTLFAEIIQTGTYGYPEYLVEPSEYVVYVDTESNIHYWYDGHKFAEQVKSRYHTRFLIPLGTAEGIKFVSTDINFGFLFKHDASEFHKLRDIVEHNSEHIKARLNRKKKAPVHKVCAGLPDILNPRGV